AHYGSPFLPPALRLRPDPRYIVLGDIELLKLIPRGDYLGTRCLLVGCEEISDEVAVATDRDPLESLHLVQDNVLSDEIAVRGPGAAHDLFFSPTVQAIPDSRLPANLRRDQTGLFDDEVLRGTVARVVLDPEVQAEATFEVLCTRPAQFPLRGQSSLARA